MKNLEISEVKDLSELFEVIKFLREGFKSKHQWTIKLFSHLIYMNKINERYGFTLKNKGQIVGGIINIKQGSFKNKDGHLVDIYNTSSFYVKPEFRGLPAIRLLKAQLDKYSNSILTSYPDGKYINLNMQLGFKEMEHTIFRISFLRTLGYFKINQINVEKCELQELNLPSKEFIFDINNLNDYLIFNITPKGNCDNQFKIISIIKYRIIKRIKIKHLSIIWCSNETELQKVLSTLTCIFFIKYKCLFVDYYNSYKFNNPKINKFKIKRKFLIKTTENCKYVPVIGSELSLKEITL